MKRLVSLLRRNVLYIWLGWLAIGISFVVVFFSGEHWLRSGAEPFHTLGPLGDWVAGLTAPFLNMAGFFMLYAAFRQQSKDMENGRREFLLQRFESTFFHLLHLHHQNVNAIRLQYSKKSREDFFEASRRFLIKKLDGNQGLERVGEVYEQVYENNYNLIDHFVRHLLFSIQSIEMSTAFDHLEESEVRRERKHYVSIMSAQLASDELFLLFYHCLFDPGHFVGPFLPLLADCGLFSPMQARNLLLDPAHWQHFLELASPKPLVN